jgi:hypothetical protein
MNVKIAKLITGETVIGILKDDFLDDVYLVMMMPKQNGEMQVQLAPYMMPFTDQGSCLANKFLVSTVDCPADFEKTYLQATSNIVIPQSNLII